MPELLTDDQVGFSPAAAPKLLSDADVGLSSLLSDEDVGLPTPPGGTTLKGAANAFLREGTKGVGAALKGLAAVSNEGTSPEPVAVHANASPEIQATEQAAIERSLKLGRSPAARLQHIEENPAYQLGQQLEEAAPEAHPVPPGEEKNFATKAAGMAGSFVPMIASGPAAPAVIGLQSAGEHISADFEQAKAEGLDDDAAAKRALERAQLSGTLQAGIFFALPKPLRAVAEKYLVEKLGVNGFARWLTGRASAAAEGAVLGASSQAGENVVEGRPVTESTGSSAAGLAAANLLLPWLRGPGGRPPGEGPVIDVQAEPVPEKPTPPNPAPAPAVKPEPVPQSAIEDLLQSWQKGQIIKPEEPKAAEAAVKEEAAKRQAEISATATPEEGAAAETTKGPESAIKLAAPGSDEVNRSVQTEATQPEAKVATESEAVKPAAEETPKSSTQLTLKPDQAKPFVDFARSIPDSEVFHEKDENGKEDYGVETEPHITALFGLTEHEPGPVAEKIAGHGRIEATLGKLSVFENDKYDVLKVDVTGESLHDLNGKLSELPNEQTFPEYKPHLTIAYLKKGEGAKYAGDPRFEGQKLSFDTVTFSPPKELRAQIGKPELPLEAKQETPAPAVKRSATGLRARKIFDRETEMNGPDVLSWISDNMRLLSKTAAKKKWGAEKYDLNKSLWDDAPTLQRPHHNVIYSPEGSGPDRVAQAAYEDGILTEPSVNELWADIERASKARSNAYVEQRRHEKILQEEIDQHKAWQRAKEKGDVEVQPADLQPGDTLHIAGEEVKVVSRDPETGDIEVQDGSKFGRQRVGSGEHIYVEKLEEAEPRPASQQAEQARKDAVLDWLNKKIESTDPMGPAERGEIGINLPRWLALEVANGVLRVVRAAYRASLNLKAAIDEGLAWLHDQKIKGFNREEAEAWLNEAVKEIPEVKDEPAWMKEEKATRAAAPTSEEQQEPPNAAEVSEAPAEASSLKQLNERSAAIAARLDEINAQRRGPGRVLDKDLKKERFALSREQLNIRRKMARDPEYVAELLKDIDAKSTELVNARKAGNGAHAKDLAVELSSLIEGDLQQVPVALRNRIYNELVARGEIMKSSTGELPEGRTLDELTAWVRSQRSDSPRPSIVDRFKESRKLADTFQRGKDALRAAFDRLTAAWEAFKEQYKAPKIDDSFREVMKAWFYAKQWTGLETHKWVQAMRLKVKNPLRRQAMSVWLDAGGDENLLRSQAELVPERFKNIWQTALTLTSSEQSMARRIGLEFERKLEDGLSAGLLEKGREHYGVPQRWEKAPEYAGEYDPYAKHVTARNPLAKLDPRDPFFALPREVPTYFDGIMNGGIPKGLDISDLVGIYNAEFHNAIADRAVIKTLKDVKARDGTPVVMISGAAKVEPKPEGARTYFIDSHWRPKDAQTADGRPYRFMDHWALRDWKFASTTEGGNPVLVRGDFLVHPDYAEFLDNELASGPRWGKLGNFVSPLLNSAAFLKASKFASATFHLATLGEHAMFHGVSPIVRGVELDPGKNPKLAGLMRNGMELGFGHQRELFEEGLTSHSGIWAHVPGLGGLMQNMSHYLFQDYLPKIKAKMGLIVLERNGKRYGGADWGGKGERKLTDQQIYELTANQANAAFGAQNWRLLGTDKRLLDVNRIFLTAPDFLLSRAKVVGQALKPFNREQRIFLLAQAAIVYGLSRVLNLILDGDPHFEPENALSVVYNGRAYSARFIVNDLYHLAREPVSFASGRFGPLTRTFIEATTQRDMRTGARIKVPIETNSGALRSAQIAIKQMASWLIPVGMEGLLPGAAGREQTGPGQIALSLVGVGSRKYTPVTQVSQWAADFNRKGDASARTYQRHRDDEARGESDYRKLDALLDAGKLDQAAEEYAELVKDGHKPESVAARYAKTQPAFTGKKDREDLFVQSLSAGQRQIYDRAVQERQERAARFKQMLNNRAAVAVTE